MANKQRIFTNSRITMNVSMVLDEAEARALRMMVDYGVPALMDTYRKCLGSAMNDHVTGLETFFTACRNELPHYLYQLDEARRFLDLKSRKE